MFHSELCWWLVDGAPLGSQRAANPQTRRFSIFLVCPARRPNFLMWSRMLIALGPRQSSYQRAPTGLPLPFVPTQTVGRRKWSSTRHSLHLSGWSSIELASLSHLHISRHRLVNIIDQFPSVSWGPCELVPISCAFPPKAEAEERERECITT